MRRYAFTRAWAAVAAGLGWAILAASPLLGVLAVMLAVVQPPRLVASHPLMLLGVGIGVSLLAGWVVGGGLIVLGQRLHLAVDMFHVQAAILERLDAVPSRPAPERPASGGRFTELGGD